MRRWDGLVVLALVAGACSTSQPGLASVKRPSLVSGITAFNHLSLTPTEQINDRDAVPLVDRILVSPP
ncbi:MAG: hypothetical protein QGI28_06430, partial [Acidimicrobiales bacterium]|nr:hypothetical protein [Acidimicrobiales bacterium]